MAIKKKNQMQENVFDGISALYAVAGGFEGTGGTYDLSNAVELPVSESGGVNISGGSPSTTQFRVHGLTAPWTSHITPGDVELTLQVPTYDEAVLNLVYGIASSTSNVKVSNVPSGAATMSLTGKGFGWPQKAVNLGILIVNDTEDAALFIKKAKLLASPEFNGEDTPFVVNLTGTVASAADPESLAILEQDSEGSGN